MNYNNYIITLLTLLMVLHNNSYAHEACPIEHQESYDTTVLFNAIIKQFYSPQTEPSILVDRFLEALNKTSQETLNFATLSKSKNLLHIANEIAHNAQLFGKTIKTIIEQNNFVIDDIVKTLKQLTKEYVSSIEKTKEEPDLFKKVVAAKKSITNFTTALITMTDETIQIIQPNNHEIYTIITTTLSNILEDINACIVNNKNFNPLTKKQWERFIMILNNYLQKNDTELMPYIHDIELIVQEIISRIEKINTHNNTQMVEKLIILYKRIVAISNQLNHYKNNQTPAYTFVRYTTTNIMHMLKKNIDSIKKITINNKNHS